MKNSKCSNCQQDTNSDALYSDLHHDDYCSECMDNTRCFSCGESYWETTRGAFDTHEEMKGAGRICSLCDDA